MPRSRRRKGRTGRTGQYPIAAIAWYGPNASHATKLVVSILDRHDKEIEVGKWITSNVDVRHDPVIAADVADFVASHRVKRPITYDRIIGCPHEEGIDYPMGRACPACPFWADIDRFTHEPLPKPVATLTAAEILAAFSRSHAEPPVEALESADARRVELTEPLLQAIQRGVANPHVPDEDASLLAYALYVVAKWRETRAYPLVLQWLSLPGEAMFDLAGDMPTEDGPRVLAAVCDGDLEAIKTLILNQNANEYGRAAGVNALSLLAAWGEVPRQRVIEMLSWLASEGLERVQSHVWDVLLSACIDIEAVSAYPALHQAYAEELIDPQFMPESDLTDAEASPAGAHLEDTRDRFPPIQDVADAIAWWGEFHEDDEDLEDDEDDAVELDEPVEPYVAAPKIGRNDPCPCGSGKKFKKCHGS